MPAEEENEAAGGGVGARAVPSTAAGTAGTVVGAAAGTAIVTAVAAGRSCISCVLAVLTASTVSFFTAGAADGDGGLEELSEDTGAVTGTGAGGAEVEVEGRGAFRSGFLTFAFPSTEIETERDMK
jgi:hypothetical protein